MDTYSFLRQLADSWVFWRCSASLQVPLSGRFCPAKRVPAKTQA